MTTLTSLVNFVALGFVSLRAVQFLVLDQVVSLELTTGGVLKSLGEDTANGALSEIPKVRGVSVVVVADVLLNRLLTCTVLSGFVLKAVFVH